jgi:hypothetical protein
MDKPMNNKKLKTTIYIITATLLLGFLSYYLYISYSQKINIFPANVGSQSFSVAWSTERQTKGCILAISKSDILKSKLLCQKTEKSNTHLLNFKKVIPDTAYNIYYISYLHFKKPNINSVNTPPISDTQPPLPDPAYGSVVNTYGARAGSSLVLLTAQTPEYQYPLATITNNSGNYSFDLNGFSQKSDSYRLEATSDGIIYNNQFVSAQTTSPIPQITVTPNDN